MSADSGGDFDQFLEHELQSRVGGLQGPSPAVGQSAYHSVFATGGTTMSLFSTLTAAASAKAAAGLATAALVVGGGSAAAVAATGSTDPAVWGQTVKAAVASCKDQLNDGEHGIGQCVSAVAKQKGVEERDAHSASAARENHGASHPTGAPATRPAGGAESRPAGVPAGPPVTPAASGGSHPTGPPVTPPSPR